ncbi:MAG: carcinine hydrolase/isopenicillin-N N-acyltransferase family protein [Candidatus Coprovivens sp.]
MCDTFGLITKNNKIFAKNSDRSPNEPQVIQFIKKHKNKNKEVKLTYITIDEVKEVNSILISRPSWMWGAEMGVNEYGLCIGNEAIFTKGKYNKTGITGMDLVRLALERTSNAKEAKDLIIELIQKYNQGGNCGYDHNFFYDNSFLIMDRKEIFILETSGKEYNVKKVSKGAISNCITLPNDNIKEDPLYRKFSGAPIRHKIVSNLLDNKLSIKDTFNILRQHNGNKYFKYGSVSSPCMHAGGIVGDHTTSSMVVDLSNDEINVYFTGTSLPCLSLFKHYTFGDKIEYPISTEINTDYWYKQEKLKRNLLTKAIPLTFYEERNKLENYIINKKIPLSESIKLEEKLYKNLNINKLPNIKRGLYYKWYWNKKNKQLEKSQQNEI